MKVEMYFLCLSCTFFMIKQLVDLNGGLSDSSAFITRNFCLCNVQSSDVLHITG